jgi:hypothetical protein
MPVKRPSTRSTAVKRLEHIVELVAGESHGERLVTGDAAQMFEYPMPLLYKMTRLTLNTGVSGATGVCADRTAADMRARTRAILRTTGDSFGAGGSASKDIAQ